MAGEPSTAFAEVKALTFDVFGTVVNWRASVTGELKAAADKKIYSEAFAELLSGTRDRFKAQTEKDWAAFAAEWRTTYYHFVKGFVPGKSTWKDIDTHHYDSLCDLLRSHELEGIYNDEEVRHLSLAWHRLRPWPDSSEGIRLLNQGYVTCTLSNGNRTLLADLDSYGSLGFRQILSGEDFKAYKPNPKVYLGAAERLGLQPGQVAMVAAHLADLEAAKSCGLRTIYVERLKEEDWKPDQDRYQEARKWVDLWVSVDQNGFVEAANRLGLS